MWIREAQTAHLLLFWLLTLVNIIVEADLSAAQLLHKVFVFRSEIQTQLNLKTILRSNNIY